ncbi:hypothetical protein H4219_003804 [Mycoemilia scoparia]|uniref:FF domain-containing protein n=1 Tax=Mycoemilia scoparia TaxID=417184 RepID=A0A9W8A351_9FUNG|nr:hypothetical protein H4219_003804 [Mycoemilia scoparia]
MPKELSGPLQEMEKQEKDKKGDSTTKASAEDRHGEQDASFKVTEMDEEDVDWMLDMLEDEEEDGANISEPQTQEIEKESKKQEEPELSPEECQEKFKTMLLEANINPFAPLEQELQKIEDDPRYNLISLLKDKQTIFDSVCAELIRKQKEFEKKNEKEVIQLSPFEQLLRQRVKSVDMEWEQFFYENRKDTRFLSLKPAPEREKQFRSFIINLKRETSPEYAKQEDNFVQLLKENREKINPEIKWKKFSKELKGDSRYKGLKSSSRREELFNEFVEKLTQKGQFSCHGRDSNQSEHSSRKRDRSRGRSRSPRRQHSSHHPSW